MAAGIQPIRTTSGPCYDPLMAQPRVYSTPAIVLRQRKLGDADKILTLRAREEHAVESPVGDRAPVDDRDATRPLAPQGRGLG